MYVNYYYQNNILLHLALFICILIICFNQIFQSRLILRLAKYILLPPPRFNILFRMLSFCLKYLTFLKISRVLLPSISGLKQKKRYLTQFHVNRLNSKNILRNFRTNRFSEQNCVWGCRLNPF